LDKHRPKSKEDEKKTTTKIQAVFDDTINERVVPGPKKMENNKSQTKLINQVDEANPQ